MKIFPANFRVGYGHDITRIATRVKLNILNDVIIKFR